MSGTINLAGRTIRLNTPIVSRRGNSSIVIHEQTRGLCFCTFEDEAGMKQCYLSSTELAGFIDEMCCEITVFAVVVD